MELRNGHWLSAVVQFVGVRHITQDEPHDLLFTDQLALHILELPKFSKSPHELATPLDCWMYFLRNAKYLDTRAATPGEQLQTQSLEQLECLAHDLEAEVVDSLTKQ